MEFPSLKIFRNEENRKTREINHRRKKKIEKKEIEKNKKGKRNRKWGAWDSEKEAGTY